MLVIFYLLYPKPLYILDSNEFSLYIFEIVDTGGDLAQPSRGFEGGNGKYLQQINEP